MSLKEEVYENNTAGESDPSLDNEAAITPEEEAGYEPVKKRGPVLVPEVQNMDDYFLKHYRDYVLQELNRRLADGDLSESLGVRIASEKIGADECWFRRFSYWRLNRTDFMIDIELRVELQVETASGVDTDFQFLYVELWFSFSDGDERCEFVEVGPAVSMPEHDGAWKLDKHLIPVLRRDEIDDYAEEMLKEYHPEALEAPRLGSAKAMAEKLRLGVMELSLYARNDTRSIIFFREGIVQVYSPNKSGVRARTEPEEVHVPANTIVINRNGRGGFGFDLNVYHECIHYEWHYLFYRLQDMHNNDIKQLKMVRRAAVRGQDVSNPVRFMEYQACYGSYGLMLPRTFMIETVEKQYKEACEGKRKDGYFDHDGQRYEIIARRIAADYNLVKASVRARLIQLGYVAAYGALNYVDGRYITPFAYSDTGCYTGNQTYVIDRRTIMELYEKDKDFQRIMQSGKFAYVDGHVVYCQPDIVKCSRFGVSLTGWANAHIDRVSLRFSRTYTGNHRYTYVFGQMNNKEAVENAFKFLDISGKMTVREMQKAADSLVEEMPMSFHGTLSYIMKGRTTVDELVDRIPISRSTLLRLRTEERKQYRLDQVIAICIGLHLPPWLSEILLDRAHLTVKRYGPYAYYGVILDCFYMDTIEDVKKFLVDNGYEPLNLKYDEE